MCSPDRFPVLAEKQFGSPSLDSAIYSLTLNKKNACEPRGRSMMKSFRQGVMPVQQMTTPISTTKIRG